MDFEQELRSPSHAAANLERDKRPITDNTGNGQLIGRGQWDRLAGALQRDVITLADGEGRKLAELSQAIAQSIDLVHR